MLRDDEASYVLGEVAGEADDLLDQLVEDADGAVLGVEAAFDDCVLRERAVAPPFELFGEQVHAVE